MAQLRHFQLFRSSTVYETLALAKEALAGQLSNLSDGELVLARYYGGYAQQTHNVHVVIGVARIGINEATEQPLKSMDFIYCGSEVTKKINDAIIALDKTSSTAGTGNVTVTYSETDGIVNISDVTVSYATVTLTEKSGEHGTTGHVEPTISVTNGDKIATGNDIEKVAKYANQNAIDLIEKLDANVTSTNGTNVQVQVIETNGVITGVNVTDNTVNADDVADAIDTITGAGLEVSNEGVITATTQAAGDNTTNVATTAFVNTAIGNLKTTADVQAVTLTEATETAGAKLVFNGVKEENGVIAAGSLTSELQLAKVATSGAASDVTTTGIGAHGTTYDIAASNVQNVLETLNTKINNLDSASALTLKKVTSEGETDAETVSADGSEYKLYQGTEVVAKFNIEKDSFVQKGEVVRGTLIDGTFTPSETGEYFIHLVINTHDGTSGATSEKDVYIPAESLVDAYTANNGGNNVEITVNNTNNTISAVIADSGVGTNELEDGAVTFGKIAAANVQDGTTASEKLTTQSYVDEKVGTAVQSVDGTTTEKAKTVNQDSHVNVKVTATTDANHNVTLSTAASLNMAKVIDGAVDTDGIATANNAADIAVAKINTLGGDKTSDDAAIATVEVKTSKGEVNDVIVTTTSANVSYAPATTGETPTPANLTAGTATGAVTGADIATIKSYVDAKSNASTTEVTSASNDGIKVTTTTGANGQTIYDVTLEVAAKAHVADTSTISSTASNLLMVDAEGKVSVSDTWDCGWF